MNDPTPPGAPADDDLVSMLGEALRRIEPVPEHVGEGARAAFAWRDIDGELADLAFDSMADAGGARSGDASRQLTFRSTATEIELMIIDGSPRQVVGQIVPPQPSRIELVSGDERHQATADHLGRFAFDGSPSGPSRLIVRGERGDAQVRTEWIVL